MKDEISVEALKATPPVTVGAMTIFGYQLSDWVLIATLIYTLLQTYFLVRDKYWRIRHVHESNRSRASGDVREDGIGTDEEDQ